MPALPGGDVDGVNARFGPRAGRPGVADLAAEAAPALVVDVQAHVDLLAQPGRAVRGTGEAQPAGAGRQPDIDDDDHRQRHQQRHESPCRPGRQRDRQNQDQRRQAGAPGQDH